MAPRFHEAARRQLPKRRTNPLEIPAFPRHGINNRGYINFYPGSWPRRLLLRESNRGTLALIEPPNLGSVRHVWCWDFLESVSLNWANARKCLKFHPLILITVDSAVNQFTTYLWILFEIVFNFASLFFSMAWLVESCSTPLLFNSPNVYVSRFNSICFRWTFAVPLWTFCIILGSS